MDSAGVAALGFVAGPHTVDAIEAWITPTFVNGWVNYDTLIYSSVQYYKHNDRVYLKGLVKDGLSLSVIFTLPPGYRPVFRRLFSTISWHSTGRIDILPTGEVQVY